MKTKIFLQTIGLLLVTLLCTVPDVSAQESADGYEWVSYTKDFPLDVAITKVRMKENITTNYTVFGLRYEDGSYCEVRLDKAKIAGTALKKLPADGEWRVCTLKTPAHLYRLLSEEARDAYGDKIQFYVNSEEYAETKLWTPAYTEFPRDKFITKIRTRRVFKYQNNYVDVSLCGLPGKYRGAVISIHYDKFQKTYKLDSNINIEYSHHTDKNGWDIYDLTDPFQFVDAKILDSNDQGSFFRKEEVLKSGALLGYEVELFIEEDIPYNVVIATTDNTRKNKSIEVPGFSEPLVYTEFNAVEPFGAFDTEQNQALYSIWCGRNVSGYVSGNKLYDQLGYNGPVVPTHQIVNGRPYRILGDDVITSVETIIEKDQNVKEVIKYENGDSLIVVQEYGVDIIKSGKIHRKAGVLTFNDGELTLELPNGDKYCGNFYRIDNRYVSKNITISSFKDITSETQMSILNNFYNGVLTKKNGTTEKYTESINESEALAAEKARTDKNEKLYKEACAKWGKKYVDTALSGNIVIGMPEELMRAFFFCTLDSESSSSRWYYAHTYNNAGHKVSYYVSVDKNTKRVDYWSK